MFGAYWNYCQISDGVLYHTGLRPTENEVYSMNKTFKIVFNKARGALMVANEITGSVQKKGTRTVVAAALATTLAILGTTANAANEENHKFYDSENKYTGIAHYYVDSVKADFSKALGSYTVTTTEPNFTQLFITGTQNQTIDDTVINLITNVPATKTQMQTALLTVASNSTVTLSGKNTVLTSTTNAYGTNHSNTTAIHSNSGILNISSDNTRIAVTTTNKEGKAAYGFDVGGGQVNLNSKTAAISVVTHTDRDNLANKEPSKWNSNARGEAIGIDAWKGTFNSSSETNLTINVEGIGTSVGTDYIKGNQPATGASYLYGVVAEGGQVNLNGTNTISVKSAAARAMGIKITNGAFTQTGGDVSGEGAVNVADTTISVTNEKGDVYGIVAEKFENRTNQISFVSSGKLTINASSSNEQANVVGISIGENANVSLNGTTQINAKKALIGSGNLNVKGDLSLNGTVSDFSGTVNISDGTTILDNTTGYFGGNVALTGQGVLQASSIKIVDGMTLNVSDGGELITTVGQVFNNDSNTEASLGSTSVTLKKGFNFGSNSYLTLTDPGVYKLSLYTNMVNASNVSELTLINASLLNDQTDSKDLTVDTSTTVGSLAGFENATIAAGKALTLNGAGDTTSLKEVILERDGSQLSQLTALKNTNVEIETLSGEGTVTIGDRTEAGASMRVGKLGMNGGSIFIDPYYGESTLAVASLNNGVLNTNVTAGTGALVAFGTDVASAKNAVAKLDGFSSLESVVYVGTNMTLGESGSIIINPSATAADESQPRKVYVARNGGLVIDQVAVGNNTVFANARGVVFNGGKLGITNATVGTITLTDATTDASVSGLSDSDITTDNPFVEAAVNGNTVVNTMSAEGGLGALASTGIQAMTRRADMVLAQTIADRTSVDQELAAGTNLWVDVTGERYEADKLDNGGEFKSDMGYGAFGADFAVTQDITAGAAFQYGKGTLRSGVSSIKNSIDSYGVTAYGAMKFGEAKVVAEASYIKNENDITSSQTALNQSVDSEIYSVGVRGQHRFTAGNFQFVPSVGVRVSRLNTDAMQVGAVNIKKQEQTLVQVPIALRVNGFEQNVSGWSVAPSFKVAYVPTFGDKEISVFGADQTVIDTSPVQGDFGIRAQNGNLMVNANMMLGGGKDGTSSVGGKVGLKYVF